MCLHQAARRPGRVAPGLALAVVGSLLALTISRVHAQGASPVPLEPVPRVDKAPIQVPQPKPPIQPLDPPPLERVPHFERLDPPPKLPGPVPPTQTDDVVAKVRQALSGHPAAERVHLLAHAEPQPFVPALTKGVSVAVYPARSEAVADLRVVGSPPCHAMDEAMAQVNAMEDALFEAAMAGIDLAVAVALRRMEERTFARENSEALALLASTRAAELRLEDMGRRLEDLLEELHALRAEQLAQPTPDPELLAQLESEIENLEAEVERTWLERDALLSDPDYLQALPLETEHEQLLNALATALDAMGRHDSGMGDLLTAQNEAKSAFNALARTTVATGEAAFPVLDFLYFSLFLQHPKPAGIPLVPGVVMDLRWEIPAGIKEIIPPFTYRLYQRVGSTLLPIDEVVPPGPGPEPGSTVVEIIEDPEQTLPVEWAIAQGSDGEVFSRSVKRLIGHRPRARVSLGLGTYCGHVEQASNTRTVEVTDDLVAEVVQTHFRFVQRGSVEVFPQTIHGSYRSPVRGPSLHARCSIDLEDYARLHGRHGPAVRPDFPFWTDSHAWDETLAHRLAKRGVRCQFPHPVQPWDPDLQRRVRTVSELALKGTISRLLDDTGISLPAPHWPDPRYDTPQPLLPPKKGGTLQPAPAAPPVAVFKPDAACDHGLHGCVPVAPAPGPPLCVKGNPDCQGLWLPGAPDPGAMGCAKQGSSCPGFVSWISYEARLGSIDWKSHTLESQVSFRVWGPNQEAP